MAKKTKQHKHLRMFVGIYKYVDNNWYEESTYTEREIPKSKSDELAFNNKARVFSENIFIRIRGVA